MSLPPSIYIIDVQYFIYLYIFSSLIQVSHYDGVDNCGYNYLESIFTLTDEHACLFLGSSSSFLLGSLSLKCSVHSSSLCLEMSCTFLPLKDYTCIYAEAFRLTLKTLKIIIHYSTSIFILTI